MKKNIIIGVLLLIIGFGMGWFSSHCYKKTCSYKKTSSLNLTQMRHVAQSSQEIRDGQYNEDSLPLLLFSLQSSMLSATTIFEDPSCMDIFFKENYAHHVYSALGLRMRRILISHKDQLQQDNKKLLRLDIAYSDESSNGGSGSLSYICKLK